jgi:hypothetical protein
MESKNEREAQFGVDGETRSRLDGVEVIKLTDWAQEPSVADLKSDLDAAKPAHDAQVVNLRRWRDLRNITGSAAPKKVRNRSQVQPKLIRRQNEWRYSALSEPFLSSSKLFDVEPATFEDETAARQNELVLNWQFRTKLNKVRFIDEYVRTAVDEGTVIVRLGWERHSETKNETVPVFNFLEVTDNEQIATLQEAINLRESNPREYEKIDEAVRAAVDFFDEQGIPVVAVPVGQEEVENVEILSNKPTLSIVNQENIYIDPACEGDLDKAKYVIHAFESTKADLKKDGRYKNLNTVNWSGNRVLSQPDNETRTPSDYQIKDDLRAPVWVYEYWGLLDIDGSEILTPVVATWIGDTMIRLEKNPFPDQKPPFVVVPYLPIKHSAFGEPDAELLEDNQAILGALMRGMIDLMARSANSQVGTAKGFLDVTNKRRFDSGQDYEFNPGNGDPRLAIYQHSYPEIPNSALTMAQLQNNEAESISGVKAFNGGLSGEAYGDVAAGIKGMLDAASKREMNILRRLAKGIQDIGVKIASMNGIFLSEKEVVRVTNEKYVTVSRDDLAGNFDLIVDINTAEVDQAKAQDLGFMLQTIGPNMSLDLMKMILAEIADLKRMPVLARQIREYEPEVDPVQEEIKNLEVAKLRMEVAEMEAAIEEKRAKTAKLRAETDNLELDFVEQETGTKHARDMEKIQSQAESNQDLAVTRALLEPRKNGESEPQIEAAVGYNALTKPLAQSGFR